MTQRIWIVGMLALAFTACGDSDGGATPCPEGFVENMTVACECEDMSQGIQTCQADGNLSACECAPGGGGSGGAGGTSSTDAGMTNVGGSGGTSGGSGGSGGAGGTGTDPVDAGAQEPADAGDNGGNQVIELPTDGNQGSVCEDASDCNQNLGCYAAGPGQGYCSAECANDDDCAAVPGADYTCSTFDGVCRVVCEGADDATSCPENMECVNTGGGGGVGGAQWRCKYPDVVIVGTGEPWSPCSNAADCADGLTCSGGGLMGATGYCTSECMQNDECAAAPDTSAIPATCEPTGFMLGQGVCALDCFGDSDGCPEGMTCNTNGLYQRCGY